MQQIELADGDIIFLEGAPADLFYIIANGQVRLTCVPRNAYPTGQVGLLEEDDYFGEEVLESDWPRQVNATAVGNVSLLTISIPDFINILTIIPTLVPRLQYILDHYRLKLKTYFSWLKEDETIYYIARRHVVFMWLNILPSTIFGVIAIPLSLFLYLKEPTSPALLRLTILVLATIFWWICSYIDWTNDYFFVTSRRIVYQERAVLFIGRRLESPLNAIQSTQTNTTQWGRWLGYGNVAIHTMIGTVLFRSIKMPEQVMALIKEHQARAQFNQYRTDLSSIKSLIEKRIRSGIQPPLSGVLPK